jgi:hypothetical protein
MDELMVKLALDYVVFNSAALEVRWGRGLNRIVELIHIPMDTIRIGLKDRLGNIDAYYYSDNWKLCRRDEYKPIPVTPFSPIPDIIKVDPNQVMLMNRYSPGNKYYSLPDYVGGLNYINLDYQMSEFATSHVKNGFFPNVIITVRNMSDEAKEFITSEFEKSQQGPANSGKPVWIFPEGDGEVKIDSLTVQQFDKLIETFDALATKNILQAHGINGILAGIAESGKLGESDEINNAYLIYQADKIIPAQNAILSRLNKILKINQLDEIKISSSTPIPFTCNEETMKSVLTVNELRDELGFGELTTEEYVNIVDNVSGKGAKGNEAGQTPPEATTTPKPKRTIPPKQV